MKAVSGADMLKVDRMEEIIDNMKTLTLETRAKCRDNQKLAKVSHSLTPPSKGYPRKV